MDKKKLKLYIFKIIYSSFHFYLIIFKLFPFYLINLQNVIRDVRTNSDITYILEKIILKKNIKYFFRHIKTLKIQETIFSKYINYINNYINCTLNTNIFKYTLLFNLHKYIISNFPTHHQGQNLLSIPTAHYLELINQRTIINTMDNDTFIQSKSSIIGGLKSIESIFEFCTSRHCLVSIAPTLGVVLNIYYIEIPIQSLLKNLHISVINKNTSNSFLCIKFLSTIVVGGDILITGDFSPKQIINSCYISLIMSMTLYKAVKVVSIQAYNLLLESLLKQYKYQGILLPAFVFEIIIKRMVSYVKIINIGDTTFHVGDIMSHILVNLINQSFIFHGLAGVLYKPILMGISKISISHSGLLSSISFQETLKSLSSLVIINQIDWLLDLKSKVIISDLLETGTGWYKHYNKIIT